MSAARIRIGDYLSRTTDRAHVRMTVNKVMRARFSPRRVMVYGLVEWFDTDTQTRDSRARSVWELRRLGGRWWITRPNFSGSGPAQRIAYRLSHEKPAQLALPLPRRARSAA